MQLCYVIAFNPDLLYCIFDFLICLPLREERGLRCIFAAVSSKLVTNRWNLCMFEFADNQACFIIMCNV